MALDALDADTREALAEHVARLKHDLGKYVAFQVRWIAPEASLEERRAALRADLLATRRGPEGEQDAPSLWRESRPSLVGERPLGNGATVDLGDLASFQQLDRAMAEVGRVVLALRAGKDDEAAVREGTRAALQAAEACRVLHRAVTGRG